MNIAAYNGAAIPPLGSFAVSSAPTNESNKVEPLMLCGKEPPQKTGLSNKRNLTNFGTSEEIMCFEIGEFGTGDKPIWVFFDGNENAIHLIHLQCL